MKAWLLGAVFGLAFGAMAWAGVAKGSDGGRLVWSGSVSGRPVEVSTFAEGNYRCFVASGQAPGSPFSISCIEHKP